MEFNLAQNIAYCREIVNEVSGLLYYSHIPSAIVALLIGIFTLVKSRYSLLSKILFSISLAFSLWVTSDLLVWILYYNNSAVMTAWAHIEMFAVLIFILCLYFLYIFIEKKDVSFLVKILFSIPVLAMIYMIPAETNLIYYDIQECIAVENPTYTSFILGLKVFFALWIICFAGYKYFKSEKSYRPQILLVSGGMLIFLLSFLVAGYIADQTYVYTYEVAGLFGMVIFLGVLSYTIVKYQAFNIKLLATEALVWTLLTLIGAQFFFIQVFTNYVLTAVTFLATFILGNYLIGSVKREVAQREKLAVLLKERESLEHLISHKVKGSFTRSKFIFAEMIEGSFGELSPQLHDMAVGGLEANNSGIKTVDLILNSFNLQSGLVRYDMKDFNLKDLVLEVVKDKKGPAEAKKLEFKTEMEDGDFVVHGDPFWIKEVLNNLVENSTRYTKEGSIIVSLKKDAKDSSKALFSIKDTGVGITEEDKKNLFKEGGRGKDSIKINTDSTGYGLYSVKLIMDAHKGAVWAESVGAGKGSQFFVALDLVK